MKFTPLVTVRSRPRRGNEAAPLPNSAPASLSARSPFYCSRRFGASRSPKKTIGSLDPATSDGRATRMLERYSGRSSYQPTDYRLCLRKTRGRKLPARSILRSNFSARPRSLWSRRRRRRPRGARATRAARSSATSSTHEVPPPSGGGTRAVIDWCSGAGVELEQTLLSDFDGHPATSAR